jgi:hypothetical protein
VADWRRAAAPADSPLPGLAAAVAEEPAPVIPVEASLWHCWQWCGGWRPDLLPAYVALHPVPDLPALLEALPALRALIEEPAHG